MSTVEKISEKRAEQRLRYRWPVRFATKVGQKPLRGQIVDVTSKGLAFLCHPGQDCPNPDQLVTAGFGVPHFNCHGSFDTVFFNRVGRVCRVDSLNEKVSRVAIQFAEPLFFQPGQQSISDSEAQQRLEAQAQSLLKTRRTDAPSKRATTRTSSKAAAKTRPRLRAGKQVSCDESTERETQAHADQMAGLSAKAADTIAAGEAEIDAGTSAPAARRRAGGTKKNAKRPASAPTQRGLLERVDSFFTDKSKIF